jgi:hypothetical protein
MLEKTTRTLESISMQKDDDVTTHHGILSVLGHTFPWFGLAAVVCSILIFANDGDHLVWLAYVMAGLGAGLGVAYFVLSLARRHARTRLRTSGSVVLALCLMAFAGLTIFVEDFIANFSIFGPPIPPSLAMSLQNAATSAAGPAGLFLKDGKSGPLVGSGWQDSHWTNPKGGELPIAISWTRNTKGIMVIATPAGKIPADQDGSPRNQQVLMNGMLEKPLNYFERQGEVMKSSSFDLFSPMYFMINDLIQSSAEPIIVYAQKHDGALPDKTRAAELLSKARTVFKFNPDSTPMATDSQIIRFVITKFTYQLMTDDMFSIEYDWEWTTPNKPTKRERDLKASGSISIHYTADGMLAMKSDGSDNPFYQLLESTQRQGAEEEARERKTNQKAQSEKPAAEE